MSPKEGNALLMVLEKRKKSDGAESSDEAPSDNYDEDLKAALSDLAAALGVQVKDAGRGVEALRTIHDVCARADGEE